jgi:hypothetical protein
MQARQSCPPVQNHAGHHTAPRILHCLLPVYFQDPSGRASKTEEGSVADASCASPIIGGSVRGSPQATGGQLRRRALRGARTPGTHLRQQADEGRPLSCPRQCSGGPRPRGYLRARGRPVSVRPPSMAALAAAGPPRRLARDPRRARTQLRSPVYSRASSSR